MQTLFSELGKRIPDHWLAHVLWPGLLFLVAVFAAVDPARVVARAEQVTREFPGKPAAAVAVCLLILAAAVVASTVADVCGSAVRAVWLGQWRGPARPVGTVLTRLRRRHAEKRLANRGTTLYRRYLPDRPTWIGDRMRIADVRVEAQYGLYLGLIWPRLWQLTDTDTRTAVREARAGFDRATRFAGWAVAYAVLAVLWWPSAVFAAALFGYAVIQGRSGIALFADTVETTVDLGHRKLAEALGHRIEDGTAMSRRVADAISDQLHKGATPRPVPTRQHPLATTGEDTAETD